MLITVVVLGFLASVDPVRPAVFVVVLRTHLTNAIAFLAGWTVSLTLLFALVLFVFGGDVSEGPGSAQRTAASIVELVIGVGLLVISTQRWRRRADDRARTGYPQVVLRRLNSLDIRRSALMGVLIQPRTLTISAAAVVARDRSGVLSSLIGFSVFAVASTAAILAILVYTIRFPEAASMRLTDVMSELERQAPLVFTMLLAAGGAYLILDGLLHLVW